MDCKIKVKEHEVSSFVKYTLLVISHQNEGQWTFQRRYSELRSFHERLRNEVNVMLPSFPPKKCCGNLNPSFVETRQRDLDQYFAKITTFPEVQASQLFASFVHAPDKVFVENQARLSVSHIDGKLSEDEECERVVGVYKDKMISIDNIDPTLDSDELAKKQLEYRNSLANVRLPPAEAFASGASYEQDSPDLDWLSTQFSEVLEAANESVTVHRLVYEL